MDSKMIDGLVALQIPEVCNDEAMRIVCGHSDVHGLRIVRNIYIMSDLPQVIRTSASDHTSISAWCHGMFTQVYYNDGNICGKT